MSTKEVKLIRFEKLGRWDYAVYVDGERDAIGKAGMVCGDAWFLARESLGGGIVWDKTMLAAVKAWAIGEMRKRYLRRKILQEMALAKMMQLPKVKEEDNENGIFIES